MAVNNVSTRWVREITHFCPNIPFLLVGTKTDLRESGDGKFVTYEEGEAKAKEIGAT